MPPDSCIIDVLLGARMSFHGAHSNQFMFGGCVYEVVEDPDDGYRSSMDDVRVIGFPERAESLGFVSVPLIMCTLKIISSSSSMRDNISQMRDISGYELVDDSGHVWLVFGTDFADDYYPCFTFFYNPPTLPLN